MSEKSYHHGNLRNSLIEAGIELINSDGIKNLSLRKVASMCGVSQAAPYTHFSSKEDLLEAMRGYAIDRFMLILQDTVKTSPNPNDQQLLISIGKSYVLFFMEHPHYLSFIFSQQCMDVNLDLHGAKNNNFPPYEFLKMHAIRILGNQGMSEEKMEDTIIAMWSTVHGLACIVTMNNVHYSKNWIEKIEDIIWNK